MSEENNTETGNLKSIKSLENYHFVVESYQRGYKWTKQQVEDLLNDIDSFQSKNGSDFYCLQPIVVKSKKWEKEDQSIDGWEVIDGQQRLTTIFMILKYLYLKEGRENPHFKIEYETREGSSEFLNKELNNEIKKDSDWNEFLDKEGHHDLDHIDNYHFFEAYKTIVKWFEDEKNKKKENFLNKLRKKTKVIWYHVTEQDIDSREIFARLNSGKIPLTNSELIKALFLNSSKGSNEEKRLKQMEIAREWDQIEYALRNDEFWYFLNKSDNNMPNRIEFIFDLMAKEYNNEQKDDDKVEEKNNDYFQFKVFNNKLKNEEMNIDKVWADVKKYFMTFEEWFEDIELYHYISFLEYFNIETIIKSQGGLNNKAKSKSEFKENLKSIITENIKDNLKDYDNNDITVTDLSYNVEKNKKTLQKILLLHNIESLDNNSRYNFKRHNEEKWSLEHIHAQNQDDLNDYNSITTFLEELKKLKGKSEVGEDEDELPTFVEYESEDKKKELLNKFNEFLIKVKDKKWYQELFELHTIENLALLTGSDNSALNKGFFHIKRDKIREKFKEGSFIPKATLNVFVKFYSESEDLNMHYWSQKDRVAYVEDIKTKLADKYDLPFQKEENNG